YKLKVNGVFEYIGWKPNSELVKDLVQLDEKNFIITNFKMETSLPGIFAVGDVRNTPLRQVITAVADGAIAAIYVDKFLYSLE
ncbi:MAG: NAD(P)/FAD-dependent oxidoreductase, partial [Candidatus Hydromicrobium sp.]